MNAISSWPHLQVFNNNIAILFFLANIDGLWNPRQSYVPLPLGDNKINTDLARSFKQGWQHLGWDKTTPKLYVWMGSNLNHQGYRHVVSRGTLSSFAPKRHVIWPLMERNLPPVVVLQNWVKNEIIHWYNGWNTRLRVSRRNVNLNQQVGQVESICHGFHASQMNLLCKLQGCFQVDDSLEYTFAAYYSGVLFMFASSRGWCNLDSASKQLQHNLSNYSFFYQTALNNWLTDNGGCTRICSSGQLVVKAK